jgi:hypothetical protein
MFWLGVPVVDNHELLMQLLVSIRNTVESPEQLTVVVFDNASTRPYGGDFDFTWPFKVVTVRSEVNRGFYRPILDLALEATPADLVGLCHNDLVIYEKGWDRRLRECFVRDGRLGMVGFCGSNQVDERGGRGGGTMVNFRGERGARTEDTGTRLTDLAPALIYDSLFIAMRQPVVACLKVDDNIQLNHFGDRIWPMRAIENEWRVGVLGIECDHLGGQTVVGIPRIEEDSRKWCEAHGVDIPKGMQAGTAVYLYAENLWLSEFRDRKHLIPAAMNGWQIRPLQRA